MIPDVDTALRALLRAEAVTDPVVELVLDPPSREWAARRNGPAVDLYLYDVREVPERRDGALVPVRDDSGRTLSRRTGARAFRLSYLLTAWTARPEDEHRLLSSCLWCLLRHEVLPLEELGQGFDLVGRAQLAVAQPPPENRKSPDLWTALGGELKPSLDVTVTLAVDAGSRVDVGPPVREPAVIEVQRRRQRDTEVIPASGRRQRRERGGVQDVEAPAP